MITPFDPCPLEAEWRTLPDNDHYEVSEYGHLRRRQNGTARTAGRMLSARLNSCSYVMYEIWRDAKARRALAHRLVAEAFISNPNAFPCVLHSDNVKRHCHFRNLRWGTSKENVADALRDGLRGLGSRSSRAKLTEEAVVEIMRSPENNVALGRKFSVTPSAVSLIRRGKNWGHFTGKSKQRNTG